MRASSVVKRQSTVTAFWLHRCCQASTCRCSSACVSMRWLKGCWLSTTLVRSRPVLGPTAMVGRVVDFQFLHQPTRLSGREHLIQGCRGMRIQVIEYQYNLLRLRIVDIDHVLDEVRPVDLGPLSGDLGIALARLSAHRPETRCRRRGARTRNPAARDTLVPSAVARGCHPEVVYWSHPCTPAESAGHTGGHRPPAHPPYGPQSRHWLWVGYTTA